MFAFDNKHSVLSTESNVINNLNDEQVYINTNFIVKVI